MLPDIPGEFIPGTIVLGFSALILIAGWALGKAELRRVAAAGRDDDGLAVALAAPAEAPAEGPAGLKTLEEVEAALTAAIAKTCDCEDCDYIADHDDVVLEQNEDDEFWRLAYSVHPWPEIPKQRDAYDFFSDGGN